MRYSFSINEKTYNGGEKFNDAAIKDVIYSITVAAALTVAA